MGEVKVVTGYIGGRKTGLAGHMRKGARQSRVAAATRSEGIIGC